MRLTSWNLLHGLDVPSSSQPRLKSAIDALESDVIGLQEVDYLQERSRNENQVALIAAAMGTDYWAFAPSIIGPPDGRWRSLQADDPTIITASGDLTLPGYGIGIVSKIPVRSWHRMELPASRLGKPMKLWANGKRRWRYVHDHPRCALAAVLENDWLIVNTHLSFVPLELLGKRTYISKRDAEGTN